MYYPEILKANIKMTFTGCMICDFTLISKDIVSIRVLVSPDL